MEKARDNFSISFKSPEHALRISSHIPDLLVAFEMGMDLETAKRWYAEHKHFQYSYGSYNFGDALRACEKVIRSRKRKAPEALDVPETLLLTQGRYTERHLE